MYADYTRILADYVDDEICGNLRLIRENLRLKTLFSTISYKIMDTYGVIGWPIKHSLSPAMHNTAFKALGIDAEYKLFEVRPEELEDFLLNRKDVIGFNITVPHKVRAKDILEEKFPSGSFYFYNKLSGAINTVKRVGNDLFYLNTDVLGFHQSLTEDLKFKPKDKNIIIIGCGGAGRAVVAGLIWKASYTKHIYIYESNAEAIRSAQEHFSKFSNTREKVEFILSEHVGNVIKKCQLLVNTTPIGMKEGDPSPIDKKFLHKDLYVYDVVYNRETQLVKDVKSSFGEKHASGGLGMLLYQGAHAFEFWTGKKAPIEVMKNALNKALVDKTSMTRFVN